MSRRLTTKEFIEKAERIHGDEIDFSRVCYVNAYTKVKLHCNVCGYEWYATPHNILCGKGCPKCAFKRISSKLRKTKEEFVRQAKQIHGNKIDFSNVEYKNSRVKVRLKCNICGHEWKAVPYSILQGKGCPNCARKYVIRKAAEKLRMSKEEFITKAKKVHGNKIDFSQVVYVNNQTKVHLKCNTCGCEWWTTPNRILLGKGCPRCAKYGFNKAKPAILYYLKIIYENKVYYKIGITNRTLRERFSLKDLQKIEVLKVWKFDKGKDAWEKEQKILQNFNDFRYKGNEKILESDGNTELFVKDVLGLDVKAQDM